MTNRDVDDFRLGGGSGGRGLGGDDLILRDDLLLTLNDGKSLFLLDGYLNFLDGLDGLVGRDLVGEALYSGERRR